MSALPLKVLAGALVAVFAFAPPADATKSRKQKKPTTTSSAAAATPQHWGTDRFPAGPLYFSGVYLGDDPDPNIRFQLWRDISGRLGGDQ